MEAGGEKRRCLLTAGRSLAAQASSAGALPWAAVGCGPAAAGRHCCGLPRLLLPLLPLVLAGEQNPAMRCCRTRSALPGGDALWGVPSHRLGGSLRRLPLAGLGPPTAESAGARHGSLLPLSPTGVAPWPADCLEAMPWVPAGEGLPAATAPVLHDVGCPQGCTPADASCCMGAESDFTSTAGWWRACSRDRLPWCWQADLLWAGGALSQAAASVCWGSVI